MDATVREQRHLQDLIRYRLDRFLELGLSIEDAEILTALDVDWRDAEALLERGCPSELVLRIIAPL